jgi:cobalamin biosynthesis protein CobT
MTTFTAETKSQLAKLLATENLRIEHQKIRTARFDPKNRVLYCPIWKDMSGALYDLLMGHEVGHALYTPAQGWHDAVCDKGKNYKSFLNVIEDARIEKKIKRKYPGIRRSFVTAYNELMERNFFEVKGKDLNKMSFINRLNLFTKSSGTIDITFTGFEQKLVEEVMRCETWEDVLRVTGLVWDYSKDEQFEMMQELDFEDLKFDEDGEYEFELEESEEGFDSNDSKKNGKSFSQSEKNGEEGEDFGSSNKFDTESNEENKEEGESFSVNRNKESTLANKDMFQPFCETDDAFRMNENTLLDEKCKEYIYLTLPTPVLKNIITPAARVQTLLTDHYTHYSNKNDLLNSFKRKNERFISLLAKEFEMKKAASCYAKAKTSNTGDIDVSKLYKYKFDDSIFKKMMRIPKGKSHGLILLLDKSGSMSNNLKGSIEQILVLAMFCRKVNIPFSVYGFGNNTGGYYIDKETDDIVENDSFFKHKVGNLHMNAVFLREYINSRMSNAEFNNALKNMVCLMNGFGRKYRYDNDYPAAEGLSNTPLTEAIVATEAITQEFRKVNNLDIVNLVIVHDGDADGLSHYHTGHDDDGSPLIGRFATNYFNVVLRDNKIHFEDKLEHDTLNSSVLKWYKQKTGANVFGFFITEENASSMNGAICKNFYTENETKNFYDRIENYHERKEAASVLIKKLKKEKFLLSKKPGFKSFFIVPGGNNLQIDDGELEIDETKKITATKLTTAFLKYNKKRQVNRVLVSKFIDGIAV